MDFLSISNQNWFGIIIFVIFLLLSVYYFSKKQNNDGIALLLFGLIFLIAVIANLLDFILPIFFLLFFISIFNQYFRKKQFHQLIWSISMFMFFLTTLFQAIGQFNNSWDPTMLRVYYIFAAFQVMLLGVGELYLLSKRNVLSQNGTIWVILVSGFFWMLFGFIYFAEGNNQDIALLGIALVGILILVYGVLDIIFALIKAKKFQVTGYQYSNFVLGFSLLMFVLSVFYTFTVPFLPGYSLNSAGSETVISSVWAQYSPVRAFSPLFAVNGAMFIFIGSIFSYVLWQYSIRKKTNKFSFSTGLFNIYFAFGVLIFSGGGFSSQLGIASILYATELLGGIFMYFGFLESDKLSLTSFIDVITLRFLRKNYMVVESSV